MNNFQLKGLFVGDKTLWKIILMLMLVSVVSVLSASTNDVFRHGFVSVYGKHIILMLTGVIVCVLISQLPTKIWRRYAFILLILGVALLLLTLVFGVERNSGTRWYKFMGITFQPSELSRLCLINYVATQLSLGEFRSKRVFWNIAVSTIIVCGLIFKENVSTSLLLGLTILVMVTISGAHKVLYRRGLIAIVIAGIIGYLILCLVPSSVLKKLPMRLDTAQARIENYNIFKSHEEKKLDLHDKDFQRVQANIAIAKGGFIGRGPGNSDIKYSLPESYSDFIYSIILEEYGLFGGVVVMLLYIFLMFKIGRIIQNTRLYYPKFLVIGIGFIICLQALIHMLVNVGIFPITGQNLPFISKGGTSYIITAIYFGLIQATCREAKEQKNFIIASLTNDPDTAPVDVEEVPEVQLTDSMYYDDETGGEKNEMGK